MNKTDTIDKQVSYYYRAENLNCAKTTLKILSDIFDIQIETQTLIAATGLNGAGEYGAQCGLVEGTIMFLGILGDHYKLPNEKITEMCRTFATKFTKRFGSLLCKELRPEGFHKDNPPHLCEERTIEAIKFASGFIETQINSF